MCSAVPKKCQWLNTWRWFKAFRRQQKTRQQLPATGFTLNAALKQPVN
jgi:hypothetical protein